MPGNAKTTTCKRCHRQIPTQHLQNHNKKCSGGNSGGAKGGPSTSKGRLSPKAQRPGFQAGDPYSQKVGEIQMEKHLATLSPAHVQKHTGMPSQFRGNTLKETDIDIHTMNISRRGDVVLFTTPFFEVPFVAMNIAGDVADDLVGLARYSNADRNEFSDLLNQDLHMVRTKELDENMSRFRIVGESLTVHIESPRDEVIGQAQAIELDTVGTEDIQMQIDMMHLPENPGFKTWSSAEGAYIIKRPTKDYTQMLLPNRRTVNADDALYEIKNLRGLQDFGIYGALRGQTNVFTATGMTGAFCLFQGIPAGSIVTIKLVRHIEVIPLPGSPLNKYTTPSVVELGDTDAFLKTSFGMIDRIQPASYNGFGTFLSTILRPIAGTVGKVASIFLGANNPVTAIANGVGGVIDGGMSIYNSYKKK